MSALSEQVLALYATLGKWRLVAKACNRRRMRHSPGYYQQISTGRIKNPPDNVIAGIAYAPQLAEQILSASQRRDTRKTVHIYPEDMEAGNAERELLWTTWPEMLRLWRKAYERSLGGADSSMFAAFDSQSARIAELETACEAQAQTIKALEAGLREITELRPIDALGSAVERAQAIAHIALKEAGL